MSVNLSKVGVRCQSTSARLVKARLVQVGAPQVPLLGLGDEIENPNWAYGEYRSRNRKLGDQLTLTMQLGPGQCTTDTSSRPWV